MAWLWLLRGEASEERSMNQNDSADDPKQPPGGNAPGTSVDGLLGGAERLLRLAVDSTPNCVFIKDSDGRYRLVNPATGLVFLAGVGPRQDGCRTGRQRRPDARDRPGVRKERPRGPRERGAGDFPRARAGPRGAHPLVRDGQGPGGVRRLQGHSGGCSGRDGTEGGGGCACPRARHREGLSRPGGHPDRRHPPRRDGRNGQPNGL